MTSPIHRNPITVGHIVQLVDNKFTDYMEQDVEQWEINEANREKQVLGDVKELLLKHAEHCWRIYILTAVMGSISLFFHCFSSPGILIGGLNYVLVAVLIWQLITVWMRQQKAYYYVDLVNGRQNH
uniref:Ribosome-recycling factor n=1 Tax=Lygus hesperus TaxID=30085 RepID=A0A0A9ZI38_LYGHE